MRTIGRSLVAVVLAVAAAACDPTQKTAPTFSLDGKYVLQSISGVSMPYETLRLIGPSHTEYDTLYIDTLRISPDSTWREFQHHRTTVNGAATASVTISNGRWSRVGDSVTLTTGPSDVNGPHVVSGPWVPGVLTLHWSPSTWIYYGGDH